MPSLTYEELADLNPTFATAEDPADGLALGEYIFRIDGHRSERSKEFKRMAVTDLTVVAGPHTGDTTTIYNVLETPQNIGRYKSLLRNMGVDIDAHGFDLARFLSGGSSIIINRLVKGSRTEGSKTDASGKKGRFTNIIGVATNEDVIAANNGQTVAGSDGSLAGAAGAASDGANPWAA